MAESTSGAPESAPDAIGAPPATDPAPSGSDGAGSGADDRIPPSWENEVRQLRAEAKRRRIEQRAVEQERDHLRGRVDSQDRAQVERLVGDRLQNPSDLWLMTQLAELRDEEGALDQERIGERVDQVLEQRPHWRVGPKPNFQSGVRPPIPQPKTLGEAFKARCWAGSFTPERLGRSAALTPIRARSAHRVSS